MSIGPFVVGERPSDPLLITVTDAAGAPRDLSTYNAVTVEGLPAGTTAITNAAQGRISYTFTAAFAQAGTASFRVKLAQADGDVDYTPYGQIEVSDAFVLRASPTQAYNATAQQVSAAELQQAQVQIALTVDRDLADATVWAAISPRDQGLLAMAISWQAVELKRTADAGLGALPGNVTAMSTAGQSVSFAPGTSVASISNLSPIVVKVLNRLSWRIRQLSGVLEAEARGAAPDPWMRHVDYVVGHNFGLYVGTLP
jgi:hypothetical protein